MRKLISLLICFVCCFALAACNSAAHKTVKPTPTVKPTVIKPKVTHKKRIARKPKVIKKVNINTATYKQLIKVKHIGPIRANRIIKYRKKYGNFKSVNDLIKVKGIDKKNLEKFKQYLKVEEKTTTLPTK